MPAGRGDIENVAGEIVKGFDAIDSSTLSYMATCSAQETLKEAIVKSISEGTYELVFYPEENPYAKG